MTANEPDGLRHGVLIGVFSSFLSWIVLIALAILTNVLSDSSITPLLVISGSYLALGYVIFPVTVYSVLRSARGTTKGIKGYILGSATTTTVCAAVSTIFVFIYAFIAAIAASGGQ